VVEFNAVGRATEGSRPADLIERIEAARRAGDWATALVTFRDHQVTLGSERLRWSLELLGAAPEDELTDHGLRVMRDFLLGRPGGALPPGVDDGGMPPMARAMTAMAQIMTLRAQGRLDEAQRVMDAVMPAVAQSDATDDRIGLLRLHFGLLQLMRGDLGAALGEFHLANAAARQRRSQFLIRNSAGDLALVHALRGDLVTARRWIAMFDDAEVDPDGEFEHTVRVGGLAAGALVAISQLRLDEASAILAQLDDVGVGEELWAFVAVARALMAFVHGDAVAGLALLDEAADSHRTTTADVGFTPQLLLSIRVDLLLAVGQAARARALLAATDDATDSLRSRRAWVAVVTGDLTEAMPLADSLAWSPKVSVRTRVDAFVAGAVARWRYDAAGTRGVDTRVEAHDLLARAVELAEPQGLVLPFALVPCDELHQIAAGGPHAEQIERLLAIPELVRVGTLLPLRVPVVELSDRELAVLAELATTRSFDAIAKRLFVSTNTVKTQVSGLYRKLGVHSREEALSVAYRDGLLQY
jgi:LuxR family maltose regulon positive regulatory protein